MSVVKFLALTGAALLFASPATAQLTVLDIGYGGIVCTMSPDIKWPDIRDRSWLEGGNVCHANEGDRVPWTQPRPREPYDPFVDEAK